MECNELVNLSNAPLEVELWTFLIALSLGRSVARSLGRAVAQSLHRSVARSLGRSVARSLGLSVARSLARWILRSNAWSLDRSLDFSIVRFISRPFKQSSPLFKATSDGHDVWGCKLNTEAFARRFLGFQVWNGCTRDYYKFSFSKCT